MQVRFRGRGFRVEELVEVAADLRVGQLRFQIPLAVKRCGFDEALGLFAGHLEQDEVSRHLLEVVDPDDVADGNLSKGYVLGADLALGVVLVRIASGQGHALHRCRVHFLVLFVALELTDKLLEDTEEHNDDGRAKDGGWVINTNRGEEVEHAGDQVEDVDQLLELEGEGDGEEGDPGVARRLPLVCWSSVLLFGNVVPVEVWRDFVSEKAVKLRTLAHLDLLWGHLGYFRLVLVSQLRVLGSVSELNTFRAL